MKVAIAGAGKVGQYIAADLVQHGHEVIILEQNSDIIRRDSAKVACTWVQADACEPFELQDIGLETCDVMVAATGDDEDNLVVSLLAKQEYAIPRVLARVNHPKNHWLFNESWGVDAAVSPPHLLTALVEEAVSVGDLVRRGDRKSTRLNSSHVEISYAVFCLKKKKKDQVVCHRV